jgi:hypothetical protein
MVLRDILRNISLILQANSLFTITSSQLCIQKKERITLNVFTAGYDYEHQILMANFFSFVPMNWIAW